MKEASLFLVVRSALRQECMICIHYRSNTHESWVTHSLPLDSPCQIWRLIGDDSSAGVSPAATPIFKLENCSSWTIIVAAVQPAAVLQPKTASSGELTELEFLGKSFWTWAYFLTLLCNFENHFHNLFEAEKWPLQRAEEGLAGII